MIKAPIFGYLFITLFATYEFIKSDWPKETNYWKLAGICTLWALYVTYIYDNL